MVSQRLLPFLFYGSLAVFAGVMFYFLHLLYTTSGRYRFDEDIEKRRMGTKEKPGRETLELTNLSTWVTFGIIIGIPAVVSALLAWYFQSPSTQFMTVFILSMTITTILARYVYKIWYASTVEKHWVNKIPYLFVGERSFPQTAAELSEIYGVPDWTFDPSKAGSKTHNKWTEDEFKRVSHEYTKLAYKYYKLEQAVNEYVSSKGLSGEKAKAAYDTLAAFRTETVKRMNGLDGVATVAKSAPRLASAVTEVIRIMTL